MALSRYPGPIPAKKWWIIYRREKKRMNLIKSCNKWNCKCLHTKKLDCMCCLDHFKMIFALYTLLYLQCKWTLWLCVSHVFSCAFFPLFFKCFNFFCKCLKHIWWISILADTQGFSIGTSSVLIIIKIIIHRHIHINLMVILMGFIPGSSSSDSDELSLSDEDADVDDSYTVPAKTPLAAFLSFKQETEKKRVSSVHTETGEKVKSCISSSYLQE